MKKTTTRILITLAMLMILPAAAQPQAVIGPPDADPAPFSVLELIATADNAGGLRLPQLTTTDRDNLEATAEFEAVKTTKALGLTIYNTTTNCVEFWNGQHWISTCTGEVCPAPNMPGTIILSKPGPLNLNEIVVLEVPAVAGMTYTWTIPEGFVYEGSSPNDNPVTLRATVPGLHNLYNISVTATNDCGNTSPPRPGNGRIQVKNCETEPHPDEIDLATIRTSLTDGEGTAANPFKVQAGATFTLTYPNLGDGTIYFSWNLDDEGSQYFSIVSQGNGTMLLTANPDKAGAVACTASAIGIIASNDCGDSPRKASGLHILITDDEDCLKPEPPGPIQFSKTDVLVGEQFTAWVVAQTGMKYTWKIPEGLLVVGTNEGTLITLKAVAVGTINLVGVGVTATNDCGNSSDPTNGSGVLTVRDQTSISPGPGNLQGRTCFDIAQTNSGGACGEIGGRQANRTDFGLRDEQDPVANVVSAPYSGVQVYTFTPPTGENVTAVRFMVDDPSGRAVDSYEQKADDPYKLVVTFNAKLQELLLDVTRDKAWRVHIYAIYTSASTEKSVKLTLSLQDCACCGAPTAGGGWLNFMCHNLGADENLDPFTYHPGLKGHLYQWGRKSDGHEVRTSTKVSGIATAAELDAQGQVQGRKTGQFIMFVYGRYIVSDWRHLPDEDLWSDIRKPPADPCPPGWKVPSSSQWTSILGSNWNWTTNGYKVGDALYLPAAGSRSARPGTSITSDPESAAPNHPYGYYWSSTADQDYSMGVYVAHQLGFSQYIKIYVGTNGGITYRNWGQSVRCVEDLTR